MIIIQALDLTGYKYGELKVIKRVENHVQKNGKSLTQWECQCGCGQIIKKTTQSIMAGKVLCSECAQKIKGEKKRKNIEGQTFGYLTVISIDRRKDENGKQRAYCLCKCRCGNEIEVNMDTLMSKYELHSCGCARKEIADKHLSRDIIGQKFNRLTVVEEYKKLTPRKIRCICDCGNEIIALKTSVMAGATQSCGCLQSERTSEANYKDRSGCISEYGIVLNKPIRQNSSGVWLYDCTCHCGKHFEGLPAEILNGHTKSCGCITESSGEYFVRKYLTEHDISFIAQYAFEDCKNINPLHFDFAILNNNQSLNALVEYDGKQHYEPIDWFGGEEQFQQQVLRDKIKDEYCKKNNIPLIRIPYYYTTNEIKQTLANIKLL